MTDERKGKVRFLRNLNDKWILVKDTGLDDIIESQAIITAEAPDGSFPMDRVKRMWDMDRRIVQVSSIAKMTLFTSLIFPKDILFQ